MLNVEEENCLKRESITTFQRQLEMIRGTKVHVRQGNNRKFLTKSRLEAE